MSPDLAPETEPDPEPTERFNLQRCTECGELTAVPLCLATSPCQVCLAVLEVAPLPARRSPPPHPKAKGSLLRSTPGKRDGTHDRWSSRARAAILLLASAIGVGCEELAPNPPEPLERSRTSHPSCRIDTSDRATNGAFDRGAAAEALGCVVIQDCRDPSGPVGSGHVRVRFAPDGSVEWATVDQPPFQGTETGTCIEERFEKVRIPAYRGDAVHVGKSFIVD